jgi:lysophospholipase L1-like esterase
MRSWRIRVLTVVASVIALGLASALPADAHARHSHHLATSEHTPSYYLSLGDSIAYGYQPNLVANGDTNPADYRSYAEDYVALNRHLRLVNFGCPGETSATMVTGGCPWPATMLHDGYGGATSQLAAATAFLAAHPGAVTLISIDIGNNDLLDLVKACESSAPTDVTGCVTAELPETLATLAANYGQILTAVRHYAPAATVVVFNMYNPLAVVLPGSDQLAAAANQVLAGVAAGADARVANAFAAINVKAGAPIEKLSVCALTWECSSYANVHPDSLGYWSLAFALGHAAR